MASHKISISVRVERDIAKKIKLKAKDEKRSLANYIQLLIEKDLSNQA